MDHEKETDMDRKLDDLFTAARNNSPPVSDRLMDAVLADAQAAMPMPASITAAAKTSPPSPRGRLRDFLSAIGGWQSVTALTASACFGLWIGYSTPENAALVGGDYAASSDVSETDYAFYSDLDDLLTEG